MFSVGFATPLPAQARPPPAAPPARSLRGVAAEPPRAEGGLAAPAALVAAIAAAGGHCRAARRQHRRRHQGQPIKAHVACRGAPPGLMWQSTRGQDVAALERQWELPSEPQEDDGQPGGRAAQKDSAEALAETCALFLLGIMAAAFRHALKSPSTENTTREAAEGISIL